MPNLDYIYEKIVAGGLLERLLLAPLKESSLQDRVVKILRVFFPLREDYSPDDLMAEYQTITSVYSKPISPKVGWPPDQVVRKARSLTRKEAREVLRAFLTITVEVIKRLDAGSRWRRSPHRCSSV
jgi:hypothetical protein